MVLLENTTTQVEPLLHSLEQSPGGTGLHVNADKTEYMRFKQNEDISTLKYVTILFLVTGLEEYYYFDQKIGLGALMRVGQKVP